MSPETSSVPKSDGSPIAAETQHLRDRLDALEIASTEREKPWFKQAANVLSIFAVVVSSGFALYQWLSEVNSKKLDELQQIAIDLIETRRAMNDVSMSQANAASAGMSQNFLSNKELILLSRGLELSREYRGRIPIEVLLTLGFEARLNGGYEDSEELFKKGISLENASLPQEEKRRQVDARVDLATLYMTPGTGVGSVAEGEKLFDDALKSVDAGTDPITTAEPAYIYLNWGQAELLAGRTQAGLDELAKSEKAYTSLPLWSPYRATGLQSVRQARNFWFQYSSSGQQFAARFAGEWTIMPNPSNSTAPAIGKLTITLDADSGAIYGISNHSNGKDLLTMLSSSGPIQMQPDGSAIFNWQGTQGSGFGLAVPISGSTSLSFSQDGKSIQATEQQPDRPSLNYTLVELPKGSTAPTH